MLRSQVVDALEQLGGAKAMCRAETDKSIGDPPPELAELIVGSRVHRALELSFLGLQRVALPLDETGHIPCVTRLRRTPQQPCPRTTRG